MIASREFRSQRADARHPGDETNSLTIHSQRKIMRSVLLWLIGIPIPIIILVALFSHF